MKSKFKILLTRKIHDFALKELRKKYDITIHYGKIPMPKKTLMKKIQNKDVLICSPYYMIDSDVIKAGKKLRCISTYSVGFDHIDVLYAKKKKIKIGYTPDVLTNATAELTITLILDLLRRATEGDRLIRKGAWKQIFGPYDYVGTEVSGKTLGILGMGRIGQSVAKKATGLGMNVLYYNRKRILKKTEVVLKSKYVSLNELFKRSDVLTIHIPYSKNTHHLIDSSKLGKMKKTAFLINTSRGKIINQKNLIDSLVQKRIQGAALDVFEEEPIKKTNKLSRLENVVLLPHIGSSTHETRWTMADITVKNLILGLNHKKPIYSV